MNTQKMLLLLSITIAVLAAIAAGAGVFLQGEGEAWTFTTLRGDSVMIQGHGLYRYDSVSGAAQVIGGDVVTLILCVPLLLVAVWLVSRGSRRGQLLLTGMLGYFLYTYASLSFLLAYNELFLLYVLLFSMSLYTFILSITRIDVEALPQHITRPLPRKSTATFLFVIGAFLVLNWVGRIILPSLTSGAAPSGLDSYATLVIQALDLGVIVPAAFITGILLLQSKPLGYLLTGVVLVKGVSMAAAISAMVASMALAGVTLSPVEVVMFPGIGLVGAFLTFQVLRSIDDNPAPKAARRLQPKPAR